MRTSRTWRGLILAAMSVALLASACSSKSDNKGGVSAGGSSTTSATSAVAKGGDLVVGAEQELKCMDWIAACSSSAWGVYAAQSLIMPRAFEFNDKSEYTPGLMMAEEPKLETSPAQKVTYKISPKAVWSDGQPITSADFKYTWDQIVNGKGIYDQTGYASIASVDTPDPQTAVATFKEVYAGWRDLFGGYYGVLPSHLLQGKDRSAEMKDGFTWSGGPWKLDHWTKGTELKLVPNTAYWGPKPNLDSLTFKFITNSSAAQQALKTGQVSMLYPQAQPELASLKGAPGIKLDTKTGLSYEALWLNTAKDPFTSKPVRQALAYALDRDAIVKQLFEPIQPDIKRIDSFSTPAFGSAANFDSYAKYSPVNTSKVDELMKGDGWAKGSDGIWAKGGKKAEFEVESTEGNQRRSLTLQIMQSQLASQGFKITAITLKKSGELFGTDLPTGAFQAALYAQTPASNDVGQCSVWCSKNIPKTADDSGQNYTRLVDPALDDAWTKADQELDVTKRLALAKQGQDALADGVPAIPIDPFPDIVAYNDTVIGVDGGTLRHNYSFGPFYYSYTWYLKKK